MTELPRWKCHKIVQAAKIIAAGPAPRSSAQLHDLGLLLTLETSPAGDRVMLWQPDAWAFRHRPEIGGYFVRYDDGYESYSPAAAFEAGYTRFA